MTYTRDLSTIINLKKNSNLNAASEKTMPTPKSNPPNLGLEFIAIARINR